MGSPEIVDFAQNFAVMVRIQGPDPKGLKMRRHAFHHYHSGQTTISASGMLLPDCLYNSSVANEYIRGEHDANMVLIVTVASIVEPFLSLQHRQNISQDVPELIHGAQIDVLVEGETRAENDTRNLDKQTPHWLPAKLLRLVDVTSSSSALQSLIEASSGSPQYGWEVGWSLSSHNNTPLNFVDVIQTQSAVAESNNPNLMGKSTTKIALLGVSSIFSKDLPNITISSSDKRGNFLLAMGSPFGILSPLHFFNSVSEGYISNCYPPRSSSLLMADIRCLPGMEGGPVFGAQAHFIGILTRPLRQKTSGAEIQLVIPWEAIATACSDLLHRKPQNAVNRIHDKGSLYAVGKTCLSNSHGSDGRAIFFHEHAISAGTPKSLIEKAMTSICLITIDDGAWASGVLLNKQGLILTNAHLLEPWRFGKTTANGGRDGTISGAPFITSENFASPGQEVDGGLQKSQVLLPKALKIADSSVGDEHEGYKFGSTYKGHRRSIRIRLDHTDPWIWCNARVVYISRGPLDVALLQAEMVPDQLCPIGFEFACPSPGSKAYVIGHGLFGPRCDFSPSVSFGIVAKVVKAKVHLPHQSSLQNNAPGDFPAMLETTAAVHPGGSGGAVVNSDGRMIGLVTSNARHGGGTVIPHLNFSIPCAALVLIFEFSKDMQDLSLLRDFDKPNEHLSSVWALMPPLSPKPGPSLPNLPQLPMEDNKKAVKGSRFAKFISERPEILKGTTQLGKIKMSANDKFRSKL